MESQLNRVYPDKPALEFKSAGFRSKTNVYNFTMQILTRQSRIADSALRVQRIYVRFHSQTLLCTARLTAEGCQSTEGNAERGGASVLQCSAPLCVVD